MGQTSPVRGSLHPSWSIGGTDKPGEAEDPRGHAADALSYVGSTTKTFSLVLLKLPLPRWQTTMANGRRWVNTRSKTNKTWNQMRFLHDRASAVDKTGNHRYDRSKNVNFTMSGSGRLAPTGKQGDQRFWRFGGDHCRSRWDQGTRGGCLILVLSTRHRFYDFRRLFTASPVRLVIGSLNSMRSESDFRMIVKLNSRGPWITSD